jgi:hypothetical protein
MNSAPLLFCAMHEIVVWAVVTPAADLPGLCGGAPLSSPQQLGAFIEGPFTMPRLQKARVNAAATSGTEMPILSKWGRLTGATGDPTCEIGVCRRGSPLSTNQPLG